MRDVAVAADGTVWVSTYGSGVSHFDPAAGSESGETRWTTYTTADGLADNVVQAIVVDQDGGLWFGTYSGVSRYGPPR